MLPSDHNYGAELTIYIEGSPEGGFVLYYGREAFASSGLLDGQVVLSKGGRPLVGTGAAGGDLPAASTETVHGGFPPGLGPHGAQFPQPRLRNLAFSLPRS